MANLPETSNFDNGVYQLETVDPVQGGVAGVTNSPLKSLVNRTRWLYDQVASIVATLASTPSTNSPTFTGDPKAPTAAPGDNDTSIATTAFVQNAVNGAITINAAGGANIVLTAAQWGEKIQILIGVLTADIAVIYPTQSGDWEVINNTTGAFGVTCRTAAGTGVTVAQTKTRRIVGDGTNIQLATNDFTSVDLAGNPTATTQTVGNASTRIATTAFVQTAATAAAAAASVSPDDASIVKNGGTGGIHVQLADASLHTTVGGLEVQLADASLSTAGGGIKVLLADTSIQLTGSGLSSPGGITGVLYAHANFV